MGNRSGREEGDPEVGQAFGTNTSHWNRMAVEETVSHCDSGKAKPILEKDLASALE